MKRYGHLFEKIATYENLRAALILTVKHKKHPKRFYRYIKNSDYYVEKLHQLLINEDYSILGHDHVFNRYDAHRKKWRKITAPAFFPDQILHTAILLIIEPIWLKGRYNWSCCGIKGKGIISAYKKIRGIIRRRSKPKYVVHLDLYHCYESINRCFVSQSLTRIFKDPRLLTLLNSILFRATGQGLPIGYSISVRFLEYFLQPIDYYIKQHLHIKHYIRFADDMLILGRNKRELRQMTDLIRWRLTSLRLAINHKNQIQSLQVRPIDFVGFKFYLNSRVCLRRYTLLSLLRTSLKVRRTNHLCITQARSFICRYSLLKRCTSKQFYVQRIKPRLSFTEARLFISNYAKRRIEYDSSCQ